MILYVCKRGDLSLKVSFTSSLFNTQISLLQTYKIIHDRSLSYLGTETSIKSDEVKLTFRLKSPLLHTYKIIWFCMSVRGEIWVLRLVLPRHFLVKFLCQDRKVSGHVLFCMSVRGEIWVLSLLLLQTYKIIHDRSLSYLGTEASMKSDEVKLALELISPSYRHTK
jgi:hypothetical protein